MELEIVAGGHDSNILIEASRVTYLLSFYSQRWAYSFTLVS